MNTQPQDALNPVLIAQLRANTRQAIRFLAEYADPDARIGECLAQLGLNLQTMEDWRDLVGVAKLCQAMAHLNQTALTLALGYAVGPAPWEVRETIIGCYHEARFAENRFAQLVEYGL